MTNFNSFFNLILFFQMNRYKRRCDRTRETVKLQRTKYSRRPIKATDTDTDTESSFSDTNVDSDTSVDIPAFAAFEAGIRSFRASSPIRFLNEMSINDTINSSDSSSTDESFDSLAPGSKVSVEDFSSRFLDLKMSHGISDVAAKGLLNLFSDSLPIPNKCPNFNDIVNTRSASWTEHKLDSDIYFSVDLKCQIQNLLTRNPDIFSHLDHCASDIVHGSIFEKLDTDSEKYVYLIMSTDGVSSVFPSKNYQLWPIMASVVNLPPLKRRSFCNLLFCSLYYGKGMPDFQTFLRLLVEQVNDFLLIYDGVIVKLKVLTLCADLPAKSKCLNMKNFNAYYGCTFCTLKGVYDSNLKKMLFPVDESFSPRDTTSHCAYVRNAIEEGEPIFGVKGDTPLSDLFDLPLVPYDVMHLLYFGVFRSLVLHMLSLESEDISLLNEKILSVLVPSDFKRKPRSFEFRLKFKAVEWRNLILYFPSVFSFCSDQSVLMVVMYMSTFTKILLKDCISESDLHDADVLICSFLKLCTELFGPSVQTMSMHAPRHLVMQVRIFGALWSTSATVFKSAYGRLKRLVTGTRCAGQLIIKRFLSSVINNPVREPSDSGLLLLGSRASKDAIVSSEYHLTFLDCDYQIFRFRYRGVLYHSFAYKKKKSSASYFAVTEDNIFVRIDYIIVRSANVLCLCTVLKKCGSIIDTISKRDIDGDRELLRNHCETFSVKYDRKCVIHGISFVRQLIVVPARESSLFFVTPVNIDYEIS